MFVPPSQVVELMAVFPSERSIKSIISEVTDGFFASSSIKRFSWAPCPKMTEIISDLGYSFAVESAYTSILDRFEKEKKIKKRLESQKKTTPKRCESDKETSDDENGSGSNKIADEKRSEQMNRLKISLNQVKQFNEPFNTQLDKQCSRCKFATDSVLVSLICNHEN